MRVRAAGITVVNYGKELASIVSDSSEMDEMAGSRERGESASVGGQDDCRKVLFVR